MDPTKEELIKELRALQEQECALLEKQNALLIENNTLLQEEIKQLKQRQVKYEMCTHCEIVDCQGNRCHIHHSDGKGVHCGACYTEAHMNTPVDRPLFSSHTQEVVQCRGRRCRLNNDDFYCESCFGPQK